MNLKHEEGGWRDADGYRWEARAVIWLEGRRERRPYFATCKLSFSPNCENLVSLFIS
jgi:hypothetical protein